MPANPIDSPSMLFSTIQSVIKAAYPQLKVGTRRDFDSVVVPAWVLISIDGDRAGTRSSNGRRAHDFSLSLQAVVATQEMDATLSACNLASQLIDLVIDNRWGATDQCELPSNILGVPSTFTLAGQVYGGWTISFNQTFYFGPPLLDDPTGVPRFARSWEVTNLDDPDQYTPLP
ncbi:hypothetical protein [Pseudomonas asplenii]|uniref:Phage protein n=2 Tax=Pseudomonas asplenii TaxID=53407 RepID=A0A1H6NHZ3_9PSED|nr:hypothetical protein [Pseudomonas fuscovaginae]SEI12598.1 hypothetical protein SAMN05216581_2495 [Pseudomonas fuscovaginae]